MYIEGVAKLVFISSVIFFVFHREIKKTIFANLNTFYYIYG